MKFPIKLPHKAEQRNRVVGLLIGLGMAVIFSLVHLIGPRATADIDLDLKFTLRQKLFENNQDLRKKYLPINKDVVFIEIDDPTLDWEKTFPDDPVYYKDIIEMLGANNAGALALVFSKDYSQQFGRKVDPEVTELLRDFFGRISQILGGNAAKKQQIVENLQMLDEFLAGPDGASYAKEVAARIEQLVYDEEANALQQYLGDVAGFALSNADLDQVAPNREKLVSEAMAEAGNVYFIYSAENKLDVPYSARDLRYNPSVRAVFEKIMRYPTLNRPENPKEGIVYDSYHNLDPEELDMLLKKGDKPLDPEVAEKIEKDLAFRRSEVETFQAQNNKISLEIPPAVKDLYVELRKVKPVHPTIGMQTVGQGIFKAEVSSDGKLRRIAPAVIFHGKLYLHIDVLLAAKYLNVELKNIVFEPRRITFRNPSSRDGKKLADIQIPLLPDGTMLVNWTGIWADTTTFHHKNLRNVYENILRYKYFNAYSRFASLPPEEQEARKAQMDEAGLAELGAMSEVATALKPEEAKALVAEIDGFKNKIAVIGLTAVGTADLNPTPLEARYPILGMHANVINTILENIFIGQVSSVYVILIFFVLALILGFFGGVIHHKSLAVVVSINSLIMLVTAGLYYFLCNYFFIVHRLDIPLLNPIMLVLLTFLLVFLYRFITEEQEKRKMQGMFSTYVNKEVVATLIEDPDKLKLGGEWMECSCFFSDVAGFTSISESMPPEDLVELLNEYLTAMTDIIFQYGGTLDKYIGDAIVAFYGAPIPQEDHARRACHSTVDMQKKLAEMRASWKERGKTELTARAGVSTGKMIVGNMGSVKRFNYTAMGENFEFGEHMESGGKKWGTIMTISENTFKQARDHIIVRLLDVDWNGSEPVRIYELMEKAETGIPDNVKKGIAIHEEAVNLYFQRKFEEAVGKFKQVFDHIPDDPPSKKGIERCEKAMKSPPEAEFDQRAAHLFGQEPAKT